MVTVVTKTTATNKKLRELLTGIRNKTLIPNPEFQRRLVWTNKDKVNFLRTVLEGYPFPEIYIAAGRVDPDTGEGSEMLVDGQQRITTLYQYFTGSQETRLPNDLLPYSELDDKAKLEFLEYIVVVRDLGSLSVPEIKEVFTRINSTKYSLNAMEINNARYEGEFKRFAEALASHRFFDIRRIFNSNDIRRMEDVRYTLTIVSTLLSSYFNRDTELEIFLNKYNDEFPYANEIRNNLEVVFEFIDTANLPINSRAWKKADFFSLLIEVYRSLIERGEKPNPQLFGEFLERFFYEVDNRIQLSDNELEFERRDVDKYAAAIFQSTNDRSKRIDRGEIIAHIIYKSL